MKCSYKDEDVTLLLKDITGLVEPQSTEEREKLIQSGKHYSEMLPIEYVPSKKYMEIYEKSLEIFSKDTAIAVGILSDKIINQKGKNIVIVSLARAGIPIGILIKHYIFKKYKINVPHYSISIIRDKGIDDNAMQYLLSHHNAENLLFVDGWIGKGAILTELKKALTPYKNVSSDLAVVADPANMTTLCGTHKDILIPSSCLNSTVSGLISRTFLRSDIIGKNDFHGAIYYQNLKDNDLSYEFINKIEENFIYNNTLIEDNQDYDNETGLDEVKRISEYFNISNINFIKPGIGETTRVLLRRLPWKILIDNRYQNSRELEHIIRLAQEKKVEIEKFNMKHYKCCGLIKNIGDI